MTARLNTCTTIEQRGVVRFLWAKNMEAKDIQDTDLLNRVQLYLLLCTINVLSYFQNG
jgi:hypothetical protein